MLDETRLQEGRRPRRATIRHRVLRLLAAIAVVTAGTLAVSAAPASAAGGCSGNYPISACIDFSGGDFVNADFYMNATPDGAAFYRFVVYINVDGTDYHEGDGFLTHTGRYCCYDHRTGGNPTRAHTAYSRIDVFTSWNALYLSAYSPSVRYIN